MIQLPQLYTKHLKKHLNCVHFLILSILINLIQEHRWIWIRLENHQLVVLGDREFCNVDLAKWLSEMKTYFSLRLKKHEYVELEDQIWFQLKE